MPKRKKTSFNPRRSKRPRKQLEPEPLQPEESGCPLPVDIIIMILSLLPVSFLRSCRLVSKKWLELITTDDLLPKLHIEHGYKTGSPWILIHSYYPRVKSQLTFVDPAGEHRRIFTLNKKYNRVSSCFQGLICIYNSVCVSLFNPTTQQELLLPKPTKGNALWHECFLGYSPKTKKYKVLRFFKKGTNKHCEVHTVGTSSWRPIACTFHRDRHTGSVVRNGFIFLPVQSLVTRRPEIVSFDLACEQFETTNSPWLRRSVPCSLFESEREIFATQRLRSGYLEIWKWNEFRDWVQMYRVWLPTICYPILIQRKILVRTGFELGYFDLETEEYVGSVYNDDKPFVAQLHLESLLDISDGGKRLVSS